MSNQNKSKVLVRISSASVMIHGFSKSGFIICTSKGKIDCAKSILKAGVDASANPVSDLQWELEKLESCETTSDLFPQPILLQPESSKAKLQSLLATVVKQSALESRPSASKLPSKTAVATNSIPPQLPIPIEANRTQTLRSRLRAKIREKEKMSTLSTPTVQTPTFRFIPSKKSSSTATNLNESISANFISGDYTKSPVSPSHRPVLDLEIKPLSEKKLKTSDKPRNKYTEDSTALTVSHSSNKTEAMLTRFQKSEDKSKELAMPTVEHHVESRQNQENNERNDSQTNPRQPPISLEETKTLVHELDSPRISQPNHQDKTSPLKRTRTNMENSPLKSENLFIGDYLMPVKVEDDCNDTPNSLKFSESKNMLTEIPVELPSSKGLIMTVNNVPYRRIELIGRGASSKVFKVISESSGQIFALKKVKLAQQDPAAIDGYLNEIELLKKLANSNYIIKLVDSELLEYGEIDLAHLLLREKASIGDPTFIRMHWTQMLRAVQQIHEEKIVHSDLKPANFLMVEGSLKLIDFGIAKAISSDTTNIHRDYQTGTLNYMAPEAILFTESSSNKAQLKLGRASDIWSLGCILYQLVYGHPPFSSLQMVQKLNAIVDPNYKISFQNVRDPALLQVMQSCLNRDPKARMTIPELLAHPFLQSRSSSSELGKVFLSREDIFEMLKTVIKDTKVVDGFDASGNMSEITTAANKYADLYYMSFRNQPQ
ncbi:hypothetical protein HK100_011773 [Physocladia obscura]|uniref:Protein kinase domain-containing protein n=1 Tax=Physocladia obscura TaxID=109957 RepID=A0AAD5TB75_9FUNG|nr:hypothetical protein HK100_011773 [Physocladia obscura]